MVMVRAVEYCGLGKLVAHSPPCTLVVRGVSSRRRSVLTIVLCGLCVFAFGYVESL